MTTTFLYSLYPTPLLHFPSRPHLTFPSRCPPTSPPPRARAVVVASYFREGWAGELFERVEGFAYTIADAAVSSAAGSPDVAGAVVEEGKAQGRDWLSSITDYMETVLKVLKDGLSTLHVPYSYGFAIILLTVLVKAATFPLTKKQVESAMAMKSLQPQVKAIQERYAGDQEKIQLETARLYKLAGVNPFAGCLPTLATIPVWIGLYRALSNVANEGLLTEGFFWIPSLAGPTTIAARQSGSGISWLFPFVDGHPPLGWSDTLAYLVLPVLLVVSQYISAQVMQPAQGNDPSQKNAQAITKFLPLMIGYFALSVPSGLSLYWFTNNVLSTAQQIWLQKLGGAKNSLKDRNTGTENPLPHINDIDLRADKSGSGLQSDIDSKRQETARKEQSDAKGPRPGERFKQLKEQEAKRRQQREEEKRRAREAAKGSSNNDVERSPSDSLVQETMQVQEHISVSASSEVTPTKINGSHLNPKKSEEETNMHSHASNDGLLNNSQKETEMRAPTVNQTNDQAGDRREESGEKD